MSKLLFICTANRCRSPMAEQLFIRLLSDKKEKLGQAGWEVSSAGTWAESGLPPDDQLIAVMDAYEINIRDHRSQEVTKPLLTAQNLVLVMEYHHLEALRFEYPELGDKIFLMSQMTGKAFDIEDPFGKALKDYQRTARLIEQILLGGYEKILQLVATGA